MPAGNPQTLITPIRRAAIIPYPLDDESVLYDPAFHTVHYLNTTAQKVWEYCDGSNSVDDIADRLARAFELPPAADSLRKQLREDVSATLNTMAKDGLIDYREAPDR